MNSPRGNRWWLTALLAFVTGVASALPASRVLVETGSVWRYLDNGSEQGTTWRQVVFDDSAWAAGPGQLGYGDGDERTVVGFGPNAGSKFITTYFRRVFVIEEAELLASVLTVELLRDDGAVVYVNGREVFRSNMPAGTVASLTLATASVAGADESAFQSQDILPGALVPGTNVIAVEVHQNSGSSSDLSFDLRLRTNPGHPGASLTRGPYLQRVSSSNAIVRWRTDVPVESHLWFGTNAANLDRSNRVGTLGTEHEVLVGGLEPETKFYYSVRTQNGILVDGLGYYVKTAPVEGVGRPTRVWVLGDSGRVNATARAVRDAYVNFASGRPADLMLMLGDNAYDNGTDIELQGAVFDMYSAVLRAAPLYPALGNHDTAGSASPAPTLPHFVSFTLPAGGELGGVPSGTEKYFSFNVANVHFVCLDSMSSSRSATGPMANWLRNDLSANRQPWVVAYWHHAPYSAGSAPSDSATESSQMRSVFGPILEQGGADLVLAGHSHDYERSWLIDGHYGPSSTFTSSMKKNGGDGRPSGNGPYYKLGGGAANQGTVYVVAGSSSQADGGALNHPAMFYSASVPGSMVLDFDAGRLEARFIDSAGANRDWFVIEKSLPEAVLITEQPQDQFVAPGSPATFAVRAVSSTPISYQWFKDGMALPAGTNSVLGFVNVLEVDSGEYFAVLANAIHSVTSRVVRIGILRAPAFVQLPLAQSVVERGSVTFSVEVTGSPLPFGYEWRKGSVAIVSNTTFSVRNFFTIADVHLEDGGDYRVVVENAANRSPGIGSPLFRLTVLPDFDSDGLPDAYEEAHGLNTNQVDDAAGDLDGDGASNRDEYETGTNPRDPDSHLRIVRLTLNDGVLLEFAAASNKTYAVQYRDDLAAPRWANLEGIVAFPTNRIVAVTDSLGTTNRYYRVVTPWAP